MNTAGREPVKVLVVDDSAVVRQVIRDVLDADPELEVIGAASDPLFARRHMEKCWPDVLVLDIEMPRMDGISFLREIMAERPTPTVICSTLTESGTRTSMDAMAAGSVSIVTKPRTGMKQFLQDASGEITGAVKAAAGANTRKLKPDIRPLTVSPSQGASQPVTHSLETTTDRVVAIGTSTGGTHALEAVIRALPATAPGIVVVQHMPEKFTAMFAERLDNLANMRVKEAASGDRIISGRALIAPGGHHLKIRLSGAHYVAEVFDGPLVNRHKPSVNVLFRSVASSAGANAAGFILTGMGDDGAQGLKAMRRSGAMTLAQDQESSVVFGMPKAAIELDAAGEVINLADVPNRIMRFGET